MFVCLSPIGTYVCSFNGTEDLTSIDNNTALHVYVYDQVHLLTREDFDFQLLVQVNNRIFGVEKKKLHSFDFQQFVKVEKTLKKKVFGVKKLNFLFRVVHLIIEIFQIQVVYCF